MPTTASGPAPGRRGGETPRRARGSLSDAEILAAAGEIIARDGLDALSMPILARQLGAGVTSIYWYFRSKAALLDALVDRLAGALHTRLPAFGPGAWPGELERHYTAYRHELLASPAYLELLADDPGRATARAEAIAARDGHVTAELAVLTEGGLDEERARRLRSACLNYTVGFVVVEHRLRVETGTLDPDLLAGARGGFAQLDPEDYPVLHALPEPEAVLLVDSRQFDTGLRLLLRGAAARGA
jgi:AcrR family transcriptional regulator